MARLIDQYRPKRLEHLQGQDEVAQRLAAYLRHPDSRAMLLLGPTGVGKGCAAECLARTLLGLPEAATQGTLRDHSGMTLVKAGEFRIDVVRQLDKEFRYVAWGGPNAWRVVFIDEADLSSKEAATAFLSILDHPPERTLFIFTSNNTVWWNADAQTRLRTRFDIYEFSGDVEANIEPCRALLRHVWHEQTGQAPESCPVDPSDYVASWGGQISYRAALQTLEAHVLKARPELDDRPAFALTLPSAPRTLFDAAPARPAPPVDTPAPVQAPTIALEGCQVVSDTFVDAFDASVPLSRVEATEAKRARVVDALNALRASGRIHNVSDRVLARSAGVSPLFAKQVRAEWSADLATV